MKINSRHALSEHRDDLYETPTCAIRSLIAIDDIPNHIWEPAAGRGAIVRPLQASGRIVEATDLIDYGCGYTGRRDYLMEPVPNGVGGIVTNPPYSLAQQFVEKAIHEVTYSAWLLRMNFVESMGRFEFFKANPPARIWVSSRRLPMMHRDGWEGKVSASNICFAWFVWDERVARKSAIDWFDWKSYE